MSETSQASTAQSPLSASSDESLIPRAIPKSRLQTSIDVLGEGIFSRVYAGTLFLDPGCSVLVPVAVKVPLPRMAGVLVREARILSLLGRTGHKGIVKFFGLCVDCLVLERYPHTVESYIQSEQLARAHRPTGFVFVGLVHWQAWHRALCGALDFVHSQGIVHCDIKSSNVLVDEALNVYLGDYSSAQVAWDPSDACVDREPLDFHDNVSVAAYSLPFTDPQLLFSATCEPSCSTDIYSLGLVLLHAATGHEPFHQAHKNDTQKRMFIRNYPPLNTLSNTESAAIRAVLPQLQSLLIHRTLP